MSLNIADCRGLGFLMGAADSHEFVFPEDLTRESVEFGASVREFIVREVQPRFDEIDITHGEAIPSLLRGLAELGFFAAETPEEFEGLGLGLKDVLPMMEQLGRASSFGVAAMVHQGIGMQPLVLGGQPELILRYVKKLVSAEMLSAYALTEPGAGSDALSGRSTAEPGPGGTFVINGMKQFITNARWAGIFQVFAQVPGVGWTAFVVERETPGLEVLAEEHKLGIRGSSTCAVRFTGVRVPADRILGEIGRGHKVAMNMLNLGRLKLGITMIGAMKELLGHSVRYGGERHQFGAPISSFGMIRQKLATMASLIFAGEAMATRTAAAIDRLTDEIKAAEVARDAKIRAADDYSVECSMAKFWLSEAAGVCADHAVQIYGGYGFVEEYPVARYYRDMRIARLYEGTNEINRLNVVNSTMRRVTKGRDAAAMRGVIAAACTAGGAEEVAPMRRMLACVFDALLRANEHDGSRPPQDVVSATAEMSAEFYACECAVVRAQRIASVGAAPSELMDLAHQLAGLSLARAGALFADRAHALAGVLGPELAHGAWNQDVVACGKLAGTRFAHERAVAECLVRHDGEWPGFRGL